MTVRRHGSRLIKDKRRRERRVFAKLTQLKAKLRHIYKSKE